MAQRRYIKFKDNLISDDTNASKSGIIPGSVYRGFDNVVNPAGLNLSLGHSLTGEIRPDINETDSDPMGVWVSRQGVTIKEDSPVQIAIETNAGNSSIRSDYVIGRHHHDVIFPGGVVATYEVIKGALNQNTPPPVQSISGNDWVILGTLIIPAGVSITDQVKFKRARVPSLGNQFPALLDQPNKFIEQQQEFQGPDKTISVATYDGITLRGALIDLDGGNLFKLTNGGNLDLMADKPAGTEIELYFVNDTTIRPFVTQLTGAHIPAGYSAGLRPIVINYDGGDNITIKFGQIATFRKFDKKDAYAAGNLVFGDFWKLMYVSDTPANILALNTTIANLNTAVTNIQTTVTNLNNLVNALDAPGTIRPVKVYGNILDYFTSTGRGKPDSNWPKHQICNGQLDTPDLRNAKLTQFAGSLDTYNAGTVPQPDVSKNSIGLVEANIPKFQLRMFGDAQPSNPDLSLNHDANVAWIRGTGSNYDYRLAQSGNGANMGLTSSFGKDGADFQKVDVTGATYAIIYIMRLTDAIIAANPI